MLNLRLFSAILFCTSILSANAVVAEPISTNKTIAVSNEQGGLNIVAVVGDQAISSFDVAARTKFVLATTKLSNTPDVIANIRPQIIRTLIDESLQMQEATKNGVSIDDKEVEQAIAGIEAQRGMPAGDIGRMLDANKVPTKTFYDQIRSQLAWGKTLSKVVRPRIKISAEEIELGKQSITAPSPLAQSATLNAKEVEISVIALPVESKKREAELAKLSDKLVAELRKGAKFEEVARQFSSGGNAKSFWIKPNQLDPAIVNALKTVKEGGITPAIRTAAGFTIVKLHSVRSSEKKQETAIAKPDAEITMKEILLKLKTTADDKEAGILLQIAKEVAENPGSCEEKTVASIKDPELYDIDVNFEKAAISELPPALKTIADSLKVGEVSTPFASEAGVRIYVMCAKKEIKGASENFVRETLFRQKFELEAQKYIRNLRREVFIEVRK